MYCTFREFNTEGVIETAVAVREHSHERQGQNSRREMYEIGGLLACCYPGKEHGKKLPTHRRFQAK